MYSLRYWYEKKHEDGKVIRLEIHKKNNSAAAMEIGDVVQELSLNIDGGEDNIDAPIVSTSLVMTFVDAYDHEDAKTKKCGNWAEFYTPDATLWKVVLLCKDAGASAFRTLWGGYVTPDSYEEDLTYRGSVTIIARDNIGHLADFPFDATGDDYGTISLRELLAEAWVKIESPMALRAYGDWMQTEGVSALDTRLNVSAFKDKSWHEAIEAALYAYGAAMRFVGDNEVMVSPLRYIANFGGSFTQSQPIFMAGATRMLTPAVKRIEETASYDLEAELQPLVKASDFSGERTLLDSENDIYGYYLSNTEEGKGWLSSDYHTIFFDSSGYGIQEADSVENLKNQMYVVADEDYAYTAEYSRYVLAQSAKVKVTFGTGFMRKRYMDTNGLPTGGYYLVPRTGTITKAYFIISVTQNGVKQYLKPNGEWAATPTAFSKANDSGLTEIEHDIDLSDFTGTILLKIEIGGIVATIPYVGISAFSIGTNEAVSLLQTNRVNTNYNEENNVIIKRDPVIAPAYNTTILPSIIKNGIFYLDGVTYKPAKAWAWAGGTPQQMAVYNHLQLLIFYAKPNNVIEGNIVNGDVSRFAHIWQFEGKEHILVSGRYNYINGFIEGAILREFARYESLWGSTGEAQLPATETNEETNKESSASSSSAASTYDNTTVVNIGSGGGGGATNLNDLQDVDVTASVAESVLYFNGTNWVDKTIQSLLAELRAIGDWFYKTDDGKSIGTKFNFFSEQEVSANGLSNGSNGGGGLISQVYGTTAFGTIAAESNSATFNAYAIDSLYKRIVSLEGKATAVSFVPALTSGKQIGTLSIDGVSTVLYAPAGYAWSEVSGKPTLIESEGVAVDGSPKVNRFGLWQGKGAYWSIGHDSNYVIQAYATANGVYLRSLTGNTDSGWKKILREGDAYSKADADGTFLKLSGGTISNGNFNPLTIKGNSTYSGIGFVRGTNSAGYLVYEGGANWSVTSENWTAAYGLIHSGNIGSQSVASATKLATARTIWGQSFDGSGNVSGNIQGGKANFTIYGYNSTSASNVNILTHDNNKSLWLGYGMNAEGNATIIAGTGIEFRYGTSRGIAAFINSSGNVTIGSSDLAGTSAKLYVDGSVYVGNKKVLERVSNNLHIGEGIRGSFDTRIYGTNILFNVSSADNAMMIGIGGNVLIGTTTDTSGNKLQVNGTILATPARESAYSSVLRGYQSGIVAGDRLSMVIGKESTSKNAAYFGFTYDGSGSSKNFASIGFHSVDNILCVAATSYVGIGTTNPRYNLHVAGDIAAEGMLRVGIDSVYGAYLVTNEEGGWTGIYSANKGTWQASNMYLMPNGDVKFVHAARVIGKDTNGDTGLFVEGAQYSIWFGIGSGNVNRGIFDINNNGWWIYRGSDTLTMISGGIKTSTGSFTGAVTMSSTLSVANALTVATNVQIPINGDRITFSSATGTYTKGILAMNTSNTYLEAPLATDSASGAKPAILIGWRGCSAATGTTMPYPITITSGEIALNGTTAINGTLKNVNNIYPNSAAERYIGTSSNPFKYVYAEWFGAATNSNLAFGANNATHIWVDTYGRVGIGTTSPQSRLDVNGDINLNNRIYTPYVFWGRDEEGLYMTTNSISWHNSSNNYQSGLFGFRYNEIIAHQSITANSGVKVASGQALTFLDASGKEHKLTYDSTAGAFKFDGSVYATEEVSALGLSSSVSSEYLGYNLLLSDVNSADMTIKHGTTISAQTAATLNFKRVIPTDIDRTCIIYIIKAASSNLSIPVVAMSGICMVNSSGAAATATATVSGVAGIMLIWDNASACWRGSVI